MPARPEIRNDIEALTPRHREVLELVARGMTNGQIADHLGITLDGAKYHVSEIITRLGVSTRDEAAAYWRAEQRLGARGRRWILSMPLRPLFLGGAAVVAVSAAVIVTAVLLAGGNAPLAPEPTSSPTAEPTPNVTATVPPVPGVPTISGLFTEPRPLPERVVVDFAPPTTTFAAVDSAHAVIFDIADGETIDLGPGDMPFFNPAGTRAAWMAGDNPGTADAKTRIIDLETGTITTLDEGRRVSWMSDTEILVSRGDQLPYAIVDVRTGRSEDVEESDIPPEAWGPELQPSRRLNYQFEASDWRPSSDGLWQAGVATWTISRIGAGEVAVLQAYFVTEVDEATVLVATELTETEGLTNLFLLDIPTLTASFVTTVRAGEKNYSFGADADYVVWTEQYCPETDESGVITRESGHIHVLERASGTVRQLRLPSDPTVAGLAGYWVSRWPTLVNGKLALGIVGWFALVEPSTLQPEVVLPVTARSWSRDLSFAASAPWGVGGPCMG